MPGVRPGMTDEWSRRALLVGLGATALTGCLADDPASGGVVSTPTQSPVPTTDGAGTETPSTTDPPADTGTLEHPTTGAPQVTPTPPSSVDSAWPMPAADAGLSNAGRGAAGPTERVGDLWRVETGAALSAPVLAGGRLFVGGDDGTVRAYDARTGDADWEQSVGGPAGTPWVLDGRLYVPTDGELVALAAGDGTEAWRVPTPGRAGVVVAAHGVYWLDESGPAVVALAHADGSERWRTDIADPWEPPIFAGADAVFVSSGTYDNRFWRLSADEGTVRNEQPRAGADFPAEQCARDGVVYAVDGFFGNVRATPVVGGESGWSRGVAYSGGGAGGTVSVGSERVYYVSNAQDEPGLWALSRSDGSVAWTVDVAGVATGRPVVADEAVLVPTDGGIEAFASDDGADLWSWDGVDLDGRLLVADDLVYAATDGTLRALRPA